MVSRLGIRVILLFMVLVIGSFDRHLTWYFTHEIIAMAESDAIPAHSDLPVKSCDAHEDITLRTNFCTVPNPVEIPVHACQVFLIPVPRILPHTVWQPPENRA